MQVFIKQEGDIEVKRGWIHLECVLPSRLTCVVLVRHLYLPFQEVNIDINRDLLPLQLMCDVYLPSLGVLYIGNMLNHCVLRDLNQILKLLPSHGRHIVDGLIEDVGFFIVQGTLFRFGLRGESIITDGMGGGRLKRCL